MWFYRPLLILYICRLPVYELWLLQFKSPLFASICAICDPFLKQILNPLQIVSLYEEFSMSSPYVATGIFLYAVLYTGRVSVCV